MEPQSIPHFETDRLTHVVIEIDYSDSSLLGYRILIALILAWVIMTSIQHGNEDKTESKIFL